MTMGDTDVDRVEIEKWDPNSPNASWVSCGRCIGGLSSEVRGLENIPPVGGALLVSNHSGGQFAADVPVLDLGGQWQVGRPRSLRRSTRTDSL